MCPVHLDREKTTNLSQATNKLNNRATRCVQYTWTGRKPPICHKPLINLITEQHRFVVFSRSRCTENHHMCPVHLDREKTTNLSQATNKLNNRATRCVQYLDRENLITEQQDVSSTGENHQSVTSH